MNETLFKIKQISAVVIFILASSLIGMITGKPIMMVVYGLFFTLVTVLILFLIRKNQRHFEIQTRDNRLLLKIIGIGLAVIALILPSITVVFSTLIPIQGDVTIATVITAAGLNLLFLIMVVGSIFLMNKNPDKQAIQIGGYAGIILASMIPGITMSFVDRSTSGIGSAYYIALAVLILAINSYSLLVREN